MRVAVVLQRDFPTGGLQRDARRLAELLAARGHEVCLVSREASGEPPAGVERRLLPVSGGSNHGRDLAFARRYRTAIADCDLAVGFDKLPNLDVYFAADDCWRARSGPLKRLLPRGRVRLALEEAVFGARGAPLIFVLTRAQQDRYETAWGTAPERFRLLPPLTDPAYRPRAGKERAPPGGPGAPLALFVGRDARLKGLDRLLRALASLGEAGPRLSVVGEVPEALRAEASRLGLAGRIRWDDGGDLAASYAAASLLVHPARREAGGKVIAEALANGLPVICSAICGYAHLVADHRAGALLAEPFDTAELSRLLAAACDPVIRRRWQGGADRAARRLAARDGLVEMADALEATGGRRPSMPEGLVRQGDSLLTPAALPLFPAGRDPFAEMEQAEGSVQRRGPRRETLEIDWQGRRLFLKRHRGVTLGEVLKNWIALRQPVVGASREWRALGRLATLDLPAAERLAFGQRGRLPTSQRSWLLMDALPPAISLEDWLATRPGRLARARMARAAGRFVARLHAAGMAHRDLYLCHLYRLETGGLALLDLHRTIFERPLAERWRVKDLAAMLFSFRPFAPTTAELSLFLAAYHAQPLSQAAERYGDFWVSVERRAAAFQAREARRPAG